MLKARRLRKGINQRYCSKQKKKICETGPLIHKARQQEVEHMSVITIGIEQLEVGMYVLEIAEQRAGTVHIKSRGRVTSEAQSKS